MLNIEITKQFPYGQEVYDIYFPFFSTGWPTNISTSVGDKGFLVCKVFRKQGTIYKKQLRLM